MLELLRLRIKHDRTRAGTGPDSPEAVPVQGPIDPGTHLFGRSEEGELFSLGIQSSQTAETGQARIGPYIHPKYSFRIGNDGVGSAGKPAIRRGRHFEACHHARLRVDLHEGASGIQSRVYSPGISFKVDMDIMHSGTNSVD